MTTLLLFIFNFIVIIVLLNLIPSKLSKHLINKFTIPNSVIDHMKKILIAFTPLIIILNSLLTYISICEEASTLKVILTSIIFIVDVVYFICISSYSKIQKKLNN